jgi:putative heme-binding domain-containing protein
VEFGPMKLHDNRSLDLLLLCILVCTSLGWADEPDRLDNYTQWGIYRGDKKGNQFAELAQINAANVHRLQRAWEYHTGDAGERTSMYSNPIIIDGRLYVCTPSLNAACIDAVTGEQIWFFDSSKHNANHQVMRGRNRGLVYWEGKQGQRIFVFVKHRVYVVDAVTGELVTSFGQGGHIDLRNDLGMDPSKASIECTAPGIVYQNMLIVASRVPEGYISTPGHIRAYDTVTGEFRWIFHTIPKPGEFGFDTWEFVEGEVYGGANAWGGFTLDEDRGWVFCATGSPTYDFYGGFRKGQNLFGNCVLALDANTGERVWHYQTVHHDLWDMDNPSAPVLVRLEHNGEAQDAVVQFTKMGFTFVLDRDTGEPLFPTPELPVPASTIPGEEAWPTQPFPTRPPPLNRLAVTEADLTRISPEAYAKAKTMFDRYAKGHIFTPPSLRGNILTPGTLGGVEWHGGAFDPFLNTIYVNSHESPSILRLREVIDPSGDQSSSPVGRGAMLYQLACAGCHKMDRKGSLPLVRNLLTSEKTDQEMKKGIRNGQGLMPAFTQFSDRDINALIAFIRSPADAQTAVDSTVSLEQQLLAEDPESLVRAALEQGNAEHGAIVFHQPHMACNKCHLVADKDNPLGPDLTSLPDETTNLNIVESVLEPSKAIRRGYEPVTLLLRDGRTHTGFIVQQRDDAVVLREPSANGATVVIPNSDIDDRKTGQTSIMPVGQVNQLAGRQQFLDLVRYLIDIRDGGASRANQLRPLDSATELKIPAARVRYVIEGYDAFTGPGGEPALAPPWGTLNAIDLVNGEILWRVPLGEYPHLVEKGIRNTGALSFGGAVATAGGLIFIAGTPDEKVRAFEKHSGRLLWQYKLPAASYATPSTYMIDGRQYLVLSAGGGGKNGTKSGDSVIAFALPESDDAAQPQRTATAAERWIELFDGRTLNGWAHMNGSHTFTVEEGAIVGRTVEGSANSFLCSTREFGDFELEVEVYVDDVTNSGIQFRSKTRPVTSGKGWSNTAGRVYGPQVEIRRFQGVGIPTTGVFYGEALGTGWLSSEETVKAGHRYHNAQDWNLLRIVAEGPRMRTWLNGHPIDDITREDVYNTHPKGFIGLQVHGITGQGPFVMKFRKIRIREL